MGECSPVAHTAKVSLYKTFWCNIRDVQELSYCDVQELSYCDVQELSYCDVRRRLGTSDQSSEVRLSLS